MRQSKMQRVWTLALLLLLLFVTNNPLLFGNHYYLPIADAWGVVTAVQPHHQTLFHSMTPRTTSNIQPRRRHVTTRLSLAQQQQQQTMSLQPYRGMASVNLYQAWLDLVRHDHVVATTTLPDDDTCRVRYGVRLAANSVRQPQESCQEFVQPVVETNESSPGGTGTMTNHPRIKAITAALEAMQNQPWSSGIQYAADKAGLVAQLQLIRTLRPPAAFDASKQGSDTKTSSTPPPYNYDQDSFVVGPLRLPLRPRVARLELPNKVLYTPWDVYHNVSPVDPRGHFLLLPTLQKDGDCQDGDDDDIIRRDNCRDQSLAAQDCHDLVYLVSTVEPRGSLMICFNSVGAGASQNHIHCHAWPSPPLPLVQEYPSKPGWQSYAVCQTKGMYDFVDLLCGGEATVEVTFLDWPCCCFLLSASATNGDDGALKRLGQVLNSVLQTIDDAPHNVCLLNRPVESYDEDEDGNEQIQTPLSGTDTNAAAVDIYVFVRSRERSLSVAPSLKLGSSEMMGLFHAQSQDEMQALCPDPWRVDDGLMFDPHDHSHDHSHDDQHAEATKMQLALEEISYEPRQDLWEAVKERLVQEFEN